MDELTKTADIAASGMKAQGLRIRVIAENMANAGTTATTANDQPYRRKLVTFKAELDRATGAHKVAVNRVATDKSELPKKFDPGHPAADANGYVASSNVNSLIEVMDMREAQRSYEANIGVLTTSQGMLSRTIDMLR
ncbi:MAG: flgC [Rhodospirillales bacterium]|nr:flgC [Rhodospirillales bacterium]